MSGSNNSDEMKTEASENTSTEEVNDNQTEQNTEENTTQQSVVDESVNESTGHDDTLEEAPAENVEEVEDDSEDSSEEVVEVLPSLEDVIKERDQLKTQLEELQGRLYKMSDAYQKKSTEVAETRKRLERTNEINQAKLRGNVVSGIFTPFENLKRSIDSCTQAGVDAGLTDGLKMVKDEFWQALEKLGLEEVPGVGSLFNPNIHEALTTMPVDDPVKNDTVVQVYTTGYRINDTVVRNAQVIVGKYFAPAKPEVSESTSATDAESSAGTDESSPTQESTADGETGSAE